MTHRSNRTSQQHAATPSSAFPQSLRGLRFPLFNPFVKKWFATEVNEGNEDCQLRRRTCSTILALLLALFNSEVIAGPRVDIVIGDKAPALERLAADELSSQLKRVYEADVKIGSIAPADAPHVIFVGSPDTNANMKPFADSWPRGEKKLTDQGHLLRSVTHNNKPALLIGGGSPVATYWAVSEFGHRLGIRSMLFGDLDPISPPPFQLGELDVVIKPTDRERGWHFFNSSPTDSGAWGLEEYRRVLNQLAKSKFNRISISVAASQPFVHFEYLGVRRQTGVLWNGEQFPVSGDTLGRKVFGGAKVFENPSFANTTTYEERVAAAKKHLTGIIDAAHEMGMIVSLIIPHSEFPKEFVAAIPNAKERGRELNLQQRVAFSPLTVNASLDTLQDDPKLAGLVKAQLRAYLDTYPTVDVVELKLWRPDMHSAANPELDVMRRLLSEPGLLRRTNGRDVEIRNWVLVSETFWQDQRPIGGIGPVYLNEPWSDLPRPRVSQIRVEGMGRMQRDIGYYVNSDGISDLDFGAYQLDRWGFAKKSDEVLRELLEPTCGEGVAEPVIKAFELIEQAGLLLYKGRKLDRADKDWINRIGDAGYLTEDRSEVRDRYLNAMNEMYRANTRAREGGRGFTLYWARRCEFAFEYMNCIEAVRNAAVAKGKKDTTTQIAELEKAIESLNNALNAMAAVARSNSDRGLIAVLNEYGYRPLKKKLAEAEEVAK